MDRTFRILLAEPETDAAPDLRPRHHPRPRPRPRPGPGPGPDADPLISSTFCVPTKQLADVEHMIEWRMSAAYHSYVNFVAALNDAVRGLKVSSQYPVSEVSFFVVCGVSESRAFETRVAGCWCHHARS